MKSTTNYYSVKINRIMKYVRKQIKIWWNLGTGEANRVAAATAQTRPSNGVPMAGLGGSQWGGGGED